MGTNFTDLTDGQAANATTFNAPLTELDNAIEAITDGTTPIAGVNVSDISTLPGCKLVTTSVTIAAASNSVIPFGNGTEIYDTDGLHDTVTTNSRITVSEAGTYIITGFVQWAANATGQRILRLYKDGSEFTDGEVRNDATSAGTTNQSHTIVAQLAASAYIQLYLQQNGVSPNLVAETAALTVQMITEY